MITETCQILSTVHRVLDGEQVNVVLRHKNTGKVRNKKVWIIADERNDILYAATHINHPSTVWARQSVENYNWLVDHLYALGQEYTFRYDKTHAAITKCFLTLQSPPHGLEKWDWTTPPCAMDEQYVISNNHVINYRNYYVKGKSHLKKYKRREIPWWFI